MSIYDEMQDVGRELLTEFKQGIISYVRNVPGGGPVDNPGSPVSTPFELVGATASGVTKKYVDSGLAIATDLQIVAPVDQRFTPDMKGSIVVDGVSLKLMHIDQKPAAGTPVVYIYIVRRGPK